MNHIRVPGRTFSLKFLRQTSCECHHYTSRLPYHKPQQDSLKRFDIPRHWKHYSQFTKNRRQMAEGSDKWIKIGPYSVFPWSIAGVESCIVVQGENLNVTFDIGYCTREAVTSDNVFISHGHIDHMSGIVHHAAKRKLNSRKAARYHVLPELISPIRTIASGVAESQGAEDAKFTELQLNPVTADNTIKLPGGYFVRPFPTVHRVPSQGYIIYKQNRKLKPEYRHLAGPEIGKLVREGVEVNHVTETPEVAYTGDTTFEVFLQPPNPDLFKVKILITEATYIDDDAHPSGVSTVERARQRSHCHLQEFVTNQQLFSDVEHIVLVHMSDKYSTQYIKKRVNELMSDELRRKVHLGTYMKETVG